MIGGVESRTVEMHFDNSDFMSKIEETIEALERLSEAIDNVNAASMGNVIKDGIEGAGQVDKAVSNIGVTFDTLGIIGASIINRLTNMGLDAIFNVSNKLAGVFRQIETGGFTRASNIEQAKFLLEGLGANIEDVMKDVDYAVKGTAYGLDEAAKAAAIFYTAGIKPGPELKRALRGVSGAAAMTGSSYQQMADIMSDAAARGSVMTTEMTRMEMQGLPATKTLLNFMNGVSKNAKGFENVSDSTRKLVNELTHGSETTNDELDKMLRGRDIDFKIFAEAMDHAFGEHATEANKTFSGSLANVRTALSRLGEAFYTPAMQGAIPLLNAIREAISSFATGLQDNFKGDNGVVKQFANNVDYLGNKLAVLLNLINGHEFTEDEIKNLTEKGYYDLVKLAEGADKTINVFQKFGQALRFISGIVFNATDKMGEAFREVFPNANITRVKDFVKQFTEFAKKLEIAFDESTKFKDIMVILFTVIKIGLNVFNGLFTVLKSVIKVLLGFSDVGDTVLGTIKNLLSGLDAKTGATKVFDTLAHTIDNSANLIKRAGHKVIDIFVDLINYMGEAISSIDNVNQAMEILGLGFVALFAQKKIRMGMSWFNRIFTIMKNFLNFFDIGKAMDENGNVIDGVVHLTTHLNDILGNTTRLLKQMTLDVNAKVLQKIAFSVLALAIALKVLADLDAAGLARGLGAVELMMGEMIGVLYVLQKFIMMDMFNKKDVSLKSIYAVGTLSNVLLKLAAAVMIMAIAVKMLAGLNPDELARGLLAFTVIMGAIFGFVIGMSKLLKKDMAKDMGVVSAAMIAIGIAVNLMARAVGKFGEMDPEQLLQGMFVLTYILGAIAAFSKTFAAGEGGKGPAGMIQAGLSMMMMAVAINILVPALERLGAMKPEELAKGLGAITGVMLILSGQSGDFKDMSGILAVAAAILILSFAFEKLGNMSIEQLGKALITVAIAMGIFVGVAAILSKFAIELEGLAVVMLSFAGAVALFGLGLNLIGTGLVAISAGILSFASVSSTALYAFLNVFHTLLQELFSLLPLMAQYAAEAFVGFIEKIAELAPRLKDALGKIITMAIQIFTENVPRLVVTGIAFILALMQGLEKAIPQFMDSVYKIFIGFLNVVAENLPAMIDAGINIMLAFINGLANGIRDHKEDIRNAILNLCEALLEAFCSFFGIASPSKVMREKGVNLIQGLIAGIKSMASKVPTALINGVKSALSKLKAYAKNFAQAGIAIITGLISGLKSKVSQIGSTLSSALHSAISKVKGYVSSFATAGKNLVLGIARGIHNGLSSVISAVGSIASQALSKFKSKLGINSPSREFAKIAIGIPEGIVKGVKQGSGMVKSAMSDVADSTIKAMQTAIQTASEEIQNGSDFTPVISPVLDLSDVRKKQAELDSMLGDRTVDLAYSTKNAARYNEGSAINQSMDKLLDRFNKLGKELTNRSNVYNINQTIDGAESPEAFANRFLNELKLEMRTG